jgi:hypothetical protein
MGYGDIGGVPGIDAIGAGAEGNFLKAPGSRAGGRLTYELGAQLGVAKTWGTVILRVSEGICIPSSYRDPSGSG